MSNSKAYIRHIYKNTEDSHQTSPAYVMTFVRWNNRDTVNYKEAEVETRKPLVVINDCVDLQVTNTKQNVTSSFSATLRAGDINYSTAVHPGDYVLINMVNFQDKAYEIYQRALKSQPINEFHDGFKGLFKVQTVRRKIEINPESGLKSYYFVVHGFGFTEMKTQLYYDPVISTVFQQSDVLFISQFAKYWNEIATSASNKKNIQEIMIILFKLLLGTGLKNTDFQISPTQNVHFKVPSTVARLLGRQSLGVSEPVIPDIYNFIFGIWDNPAQQIKEDQGSEYKGFNPNAKYHKNDSNFYTIGKEIEGWRILAAENFNQKEIWSVLQSYLNGTVNEMYTTYRVSPENNNRVYPTVVVRQKPFSSEHYVSPQVTTPVKPEPKPYTKFLSLPRWKISSDLMFMVDLGKDEAARVNFVQVFGRSLAASDAENRSMQVGKGNFFYDGKDVQRHGLKPIIASSVFDYPGGISETQSRNWAYLLFDMLNAGQLKESGAISSVGIVHPISVGDNLEFDDCVYHIEQVTHNMKEDPDGKLSFRTNLILSFGTNLNSTKDLPIYPQMQHTDSYRERLKDNANEGILPGVSDTQDIAGRVQGEEVQETKEQSFTGGSVDKKGMERASSLSYNVKKDKLSKDE
ncbi:MAG TPA: hypothetical protein VI911_12240 [Patescibacteria group bacterium]|nr:hypothetical protein [Patescibacteria group bacterium]